MLLNLLYQSSVAKEQAYTRPELEKRIQETRSLGYALVNRPGRVSERSSLAVPVRISEDTLCSIVIRFARSAVKQQVAAETFLPAARQTAHAIINAFGAERSPGSDAAAGAAAEAAKVASTSKRRKTHP